MALAGEPVTAVPANDFLNSIGVNSAINRRGESINRTIECAQYLGFRWIRTDASLNSNSDENDVKKLYEQADVKVSTSLGSGGTNINNLVAGSKRIAALGALVAIEGCNEPNNWSITYQGEKTGGSESWAGLARLHHNLYLAVKADDVLKDYPVWTLSANGAETDNVGLQFLTVPEDNTAVKEEFRGWTFADVANCHNYFAHSSWAAPQNNQTWLSSDPTSSAKGDHLYGNFGKTWRKGFLGYPQAELNTIPKVTTETGITIDATVTEEMQALMYLSCYLAQFKQGWSRTAMYILRDRSDEGGNQTFGFYRTNYQPRLSARYLHNLTTILKDDPNAELYPLETVGYDAYLPPTGHDLLLQKSDGSLFLIIWGERYKSLTPIDVEVKFDKKYDINVYNPAQWDASQPEKGTLPIQTETNVGSITIPIGTVPFILELKPASVVEALPEISKPITVSTQKGKVLLNAHRQTVDYSICNLIGQPVAKGSITGEKEIALSQGIYIVKTNNKTTKLIIDN
jgi:hypothetical protein